MRSSRDDVALIKADPPGIITDHDFQVKVLAEDRGWIDSYSVSIAVPDQEVAADTVAYLTVSAAMSSSSPAGAPGLISE